MSVGHAGHGETGQTVRSYTFFTVSIENAFSALALAAPTRGVLCASCPYNSKFSAQGRRVSITTKCQCNLIIANPDFLSHIMSAFLCALLSNDQLIHSVNCAGKMEMVCRHASKQESRVFSRITGLSL